MKKDIRHMMANMKSKLTELKTLHNQLIKTNQKQIFLFCLDSFFYQYKIFSMELENIDKLRCLFNNRMYCDYYKLHNIVLKFIKDYQKTNAEVDENLFPEGKSFPVYKDLEPFLQYDIEDIRSIHTSILQSVNYLHKCYLVKSDAIVNYNQHHRIGFSISNFLNTLTHENNLLHEQIALYVNYISFFHISQKRQLSRLCSRIQDFCQEVDTNINMNHTFSIEDIVADPTIESNYSIIDEIPPAPVSTPTTTVSRHEPVVMSVASAELHGTSNDHSFTEKKLEDLPKFTPLTLENLGGEGGDISPLSASDAASSH